MPPVLLDPRGVRVPVQQVEATCAPESRTHAIDDDLSTRWTCVGESPDQSLTADLGAPTSVGAIVHALGMAGAEFPHHLVIESSVDGATWTKAWEGSPAAAVLHAARAAPREARALIEFPPRTARYIRLRQLVRNDAYAWSIAELEVWSGAGDQSR
jgi:hypothetical protein